MSIKNGIKSILRIVPDKLYLRIIYRMKMKKKLDLNHPKTYNEKLQWLKLYDRNPLYTQMVDKYLAKEYVSNIIGSDYIIPTLGVWERFEDIDFNILPNKFVLKCTHDSGGLVICDNKECFDIEAAKKKITECLLHEYFWDGREWPYKNVKPRIIAEEYMEDSSTHELRDYKFFTFDGKVKALFIASERQNKNNETRFDFFDSDFNHLPFTNGHPNADVLPNKPMCFEEMKSIAERLSEGIPHLRVDLYEVNGKIYFGELTFSHWSGMVPFDPDNWDAIWGEWIKLPNEIHK